MEYQFYNKPVAEAIYDAFQAEPFYLAIANARTNQAESVREVLIKYFDFSIKEAQQHGVFQTIDNQAFGASIWHKPTSEEQYEQQVAAKKSFLRKHLGEASLAIYKKMESFMETKEEAFIEDHYWYLSILAVAKKHQGKGYGRQLLAPVLAEADRLGIPTFLETFTEENLIFYGKLGYEVATEYLEPHLNKVCWVLIRPVHSYSL